MGKHSPKGQIVLKRDRKLEVVYRAMPPQSALEEHMAKFKELYPEDWQSLVYRYKEHERHTPKGVCFFCNDTELEKNQRIMTHRT